LAERRRRRIPQSFTRRAVYSFLLIAAVVLVGTVGMHAIEGMSYLDSFYFTSMLATGQGPNYTPVTVGGKIFAALLAFVSVGIVITALVFLFGPFFGAVLRSGMEKIEEEAEKELRKV
jgi:voltage-gated potassium channel